MTEGSAPDLDIRKYWGILLKRRYLALAVGLTVVSALTWGSFLWPKTYAASSTVFIERSALIDPLIKGVGVSANMEDRLRTLKTGITSRNIIERTLRKLDLDAMTRTPAKFKALIDSVQKKLTVTVGGPRSGKETDLFTISYEDHDPRVVSDLVNTLVSEYIEENTNYRRSDAFGAYEFIESQVMEYRKKLEESDSAIREFREKNPFMVPQSETSVLGRMEALQTQKMEAEIKLRELLRRRENLQKQLSGEKELTVAIVTRESPQARLNYLNNQLVILLTKYTSNYPEVVKVKTEIEELKRQISEARDSAGEASSSETATLNPIYQQLKEELAKTDAEVESTRGRIDELSRQHQNSASVLGRLPKEQEEWTKLQRDRNVHQKIYDELVQRLENARVSKELELTDKNPSFRVIDPAILPTSPAKPNRVVMILLGIFLGIASGIGVAIGLEFLDGSFKDEQSVTEALKLPVLAAIPKMRLESEEVAEKKRDAKVFAAAGAYMVVIGLAFAMEVLRKFLGIKILDI